MPVVPVTKEVLVRVYECLCKDCKDWKRTYTIKGNAECAMLGHRRLKHGYIPWTAKVVSNGTTSHRKPAKVRQSI